MNYWIFFYGWALSQSEVSQKRNSLKNNYTISFATGFFINLGFPRAQGLALLFLIIFLFFNQGLVFLYLLFVNAYPMYSNSYVLCVAHQREVEFAQTESGV